MLVSYSFTEQIMKTTSVKEAGYRAQVASRIWRNMAKSESELRILINLRRLNLGTSTLENFIGNLRDENKYKRGIGGTFWQYQGGGDLLGEF